MALRMLLATRPLEGHMLLGASLAMTLHLSQDYEPTPRGADAPPLILPNDLGEGTNGDGFDAEVLPGLLAAGATGALQGGAMRFWYPLVETVAQRHATTRLAQTLLKVALDAAPAAVSTLGLHAAAKLFYARTYGGLADPDSLLGRLAQLADGVAQQAQALRSSGGGSGDDDDDGAPLALPPDALPLDEVAAIEAVLDTRPTRANWVTAAVTALNFTLLPRQLRGVVGTAQWQLYELNASEELDSQPERPLSLEAPSSSSSWVAVVGRGGWGDAPPPPGPRARERGEGEEEAAAAAAAAAAKARDEGYVQATQPRRASSGGREGRPRDTTLR